MNPEPATPELVPVDLAAQLAEIETEPLEEHASLFAKLHEDLREQLEDADAAPAGQA